MEQRSNAFLETEPVGAVALFIAQMLPVSVIDLFGASNENAYYRVFAIHCFRTYLCMMIQAPVNKGTFIYLQSLGKAAASTIISLMREVVFGVALPILMPMAMGLDGLLWSFPAADVLTFLIAAVIILRTYKELNTPV